MRFLYTSFLIVLVLLAGKLGAFERETVNPSARPMRRVEERSRDHPQGRGMLPPFYREGKIEYHQSQIITPQAMAHPQTRHYINHYSSAGGRAYLSAVMVRGGMYQAFIRQQIAGMNLPPELIYLPVIESSYVPTALSRSGASGLWQFMTNSMGPFDMTVTEWMDERRDFWKSTQGALRKLQENREFFGDWHLALAAYNAGLGAVNRMIQQSGERDYWILYQRGFLRTETAHYVPKLTAAAHVMTNQRRYGLDIDWPEDPQWQRAAVGRQTDLRILAEYAGVDPDELIRANRELYHHISPPGDAYFLKVRAENLEQVTAVLADRSITLVRHYIHTIRSGDTLLALALHFGTTVDQILNVNPGVQARNLRIGSSLVIPAVRETGPFQRSIPEVLEFNGNHLVKRGETLWSIALAYEVDPEVLAEANNMGISDILREGRVLRTPIR